MTVAHQRITDLSDRIDAIIPGLADIAPGYALLDFPDYSNIGDSLIWLGELAYFERHGGRRPAYVCTTAGFDAAALGSALPEGPIFLSGGGNFGDIWPRFQAFRHQVLAAFPGRRIVQLPQTIHFSTPAALADTRDAIRRHGNFTMLVRDEASLRVALEQLECDARLCPDMAFCMGPQRRADAAPSHDIVALLRTDKERLGEAETPVAPAGLSLLTTDWIRREPKPTLTQRAVNAVRRIFPEDPYDLFAGRAKAERARGIALLSSGRVVVTDRLHGHILSVLLDLPQVVLDNSYGKISGFSALWTHDVAGVHGSTTLASALDQARDLI